MLEVKLFTSFFETPLYINILPEQISAGARHDAWLLRPGRRDVRPGEGGGPLEPGQEVYQAARGDVASHQRRGEETRCHQAYCTRLNLRYVLTSGEERGPGQPNLITFKICFLTLRSFALKSSIYKIEFCREFKLYK